jgi:thiamine-monophosphate kinase
MAEASHVCFEFDTQLIAGAAEFAALNELATEINGDVWKWILGGGEDHVLLATGIDLPGIKIGKVIAGSGISGIEMKKAPVSWSHFS